MLWLNPLLRPMEHGANGWLDDILTWGVIALVVVMIGVYVYQMVRQRAAEQEGQTHDDQE